MPKNLLHFLRNRKIVNAELDEEGDIVIDLDNETRLVLFTGPFSVTYVCVEDP